MKCAFSRIRLAQMKEKESLHNSELPSFLESPHREVPVVFTVPTSLNGSSFSTEDLL